MSVFPDSGVYVTFTGSIALTFDADGDALPADITITATNSALIVTTFAGLELISNPSDKWQRVELTGALPLGESYDIDVLFDGISVYQEAVDIPAPGSRRARVLRQRIYEVLLAAYRAAPDVCPVPYGDGHVPGSINLDFKSDNCVVVEVGVAYAGTIGLADYRTRMATVTVPLNIYQDMDDAEDAEELSGEMEALGDYLIATDWRLNGFGLIQSQASFEGGQPEINEERKMVTISGNLTITMRRGAIR